MRIPAKLRCRIKAARKRGAWWIRIVDVVRFLPTSEGRALLWTRLAHRNEVHQTTPFTADDRYPDLFDLAAKIAPGAQRILSFGCSTGEELKAIRRRFRGAEIVGAEINPRSRRIAARRTAGDGRTRVVPPQAIDGTFDTIFALAVFQREPHKVTETEAQDISSLYPFARFDTAVTELVGRLRPGGLLCVTNAQYRLEDSSAAAELEPVEQSPEARGAFFGRDGQRLGALSARMIFRKRAAPPADER
jgi:SAM-dependent methyltransferase